MNIMKRIKFVISLCGMSEKLFEEHILLWGPYRQLIIYFTLLELETAKIEKVSDLIDHLKNDVDMLQLDELAYKSFVFDHIFVNHEDSLYRLNENKSISDLFQDFPEDDIELHYIVISGGASLVSMGYRFVVHPDEEVHKNMPHVHVIKDGNNARYSLETLKIIDANSKKAEDFFKREEKKKIIPVLKEQYDWFIKKWNLYQKGYVPSETNEDGMECPNWWKVDQK